MFHLLITIACLAGLTKAAPRTHGVSSLDGRIIGGESTFIENHPYQASLQYLSLRHKCGAVIIGENIVLTAAHCTDG